jgi:hypothetical protein
MALIRSKFGRLAAAIGIGLAVEILLLAGGTLISPKFPKPWDERVWAVTQEPAYHLVDWLAKAEHPGFESQGAFFMLIPLTQWVLWSAISYWLMSRRARAPRPL